MARAARVQPSTTPGFTRSFSSGADASFCGFNPGKQPSQRQPSLHPTSQLGSIKMILERFQAELLAFYRQVNLKTHGTLEIWRHAFLRFNRVQGMEASAAVAYYAIFSIFPLLLSLISLAGFLLSRNQAVELVLEFVAQVIPVAPPNLET